MVPRWVTHISCHCKNTIRGTGKNKINEQTRTMLGLNSEQKESMQHYISDSIYGLTLAWITSENSTKQLECWHLLPSLWLDPIFSTVSGVDRISHRVPSPTLCQRLSPTNSLLSSRYLFRPRRDFKSENPLSGFAPKQTKESSAWRATHIVLQLIHLSNSQMFLVINSKHFLVIQIFPTFLYFTLFTHPSLIWYH